MTDAKFIDFPDLKARISIEQAAQMLGLNLTKHGSQFRGSCPVHGGGDRTLVVTPGKGFYCFAEKQGGDQISLVAHCRQMPVRDAAAWMLDGIGGSAPKPVKEKMPAAPQRPPNGLKALDYLQHDHESVKALGLAPETVQAWGAGFAAKGIMRGRFAVPIHDREGTLLAYVGIAVSDEQSPKLLFPNGFDPHSAIFGADRVQAGELYLVREPLQVLTAHESGVENVVSFLAPITAQSLEQLAALMDEKKVETVELF
jgi:CHC2 zinc finger